MEKELVSLAKQKEDEVTWSKIDCLFLKLTEELKTKEEATNIIPHSKELLLRSISSDRSKLSGTAIGLLKRFVDLLQEEMQFLNEIVPVLLKVCGISNRIVSRRGQDAIVHIFKYVDLLPFCKILGESASSSNKNVRLAVFKAFEVSKEIPKLLDKVILKGKDDAFHEVRTIAKAITENNMKPIVSTPIKSKETSNRINFIPFKDNKLIPPVSNSPLRKVFKVENKDNEKINELEQRVRAITNPQVTKSKVQKIVKSYKTRDLLSTIPKKEKEVHDDLTPKKLDKFLSKYRNVYGNVLEEKKEEVVAVDNSPQDEKVEEIIEEQVYNDQLEETVVNETIPDLNNDNTLSSVVSNEEGEPQRNSPVFNTEPLTLNMNESCEDKNNLEILLDDYNDERSLEKELESLSIVIEDDLPSLNSNQIEYTIVNSGVDATILKCPPVEHNSSNRFSPLMVPKKDECLIFDLQNDRLNCKTPTTSNKEEALTSPMNIPVVPHTLSSSFLHSKQDDQGSEDFTQIDSLIYADKKTFKRSDK